jgi:lipopolysaccharide export LptBFGC system permease protein LptF
MGYQGGTMSYTLLGLGLSSLALAGVFSMLIGYAFIVVTALLVSIPLIKERRKKRGVKSAG